MNAHYHATSLALAAVIAFAGIPAAMAEIAPPIEELVALALERSPSLDAFEARLAAAREMVAPAGALPNPMAETVLQNIGVDDFTLGDEDMSMLSVEVRQDLLWPGKRGAARDSAAAQSEVEAARLELARRTLATEVRVLYAGVYSADRERQALDAASELLDLLAETVAARYAAGGAEQEAVVKAQLQGSRVAERLDDLHAERSRFVAGLNRLLDQPGGTALGEVVDLPPLTFPDGSWEELVAANSPAVAVAARAVDEAARRLEVARLDLKPNLSAGAGLGYRGGLDPAVMLRFGVEIPFARNEKQKPAIRAAEQELAMAEAELRDAVATARAEAARLASERERADRQVLRYREAIVPQTSAAVDAARASYLAGRGDFSTVIEDFELWLEARVELARRESDRFAAWAQLEALVGPAPLGEGGAE
ncbi:MAG TPA: TolC family protein [Thermoanaerobaculales bacterium]|nr:TolC family protein [Thermoanaerobaculales bacterium]